MYSNCLYDNDNGPLRNTSEKKNRSNEKYVAEEDFIASVRMNEILINFRYFEMKRIHLAIIIAL